MSLRIAIIDATSIIGIKHLRGRKHWPILRGLEARIEDGSLTFPDEVLREVKGVAHLDAPGAWADGVEDNRRPPKQPEDELVAEVLAQCPGLVDPDRPVHGDPYVVALAVHFARGSHDVVVVSDDVRDRQDRLSVRAACDMLGIAHLRLEEYLAEEDL
jgi:hypothetical protein